MDPLGSRSKYLQHSRQEVASLTLACDKPQIPVPATLSSVIGLIAYGPVYFDGDYSLLQVTAYSEVPGQTVPNARLQVVADPATFRGTLNYQDPTAEELIVTTGADGTANLVIRPKTRSLPARCTENPARGGTGRPRSPRKQGAGRPGDPARTAPPGCIRKPAEPERGGSRRGGSGGFRSRSREPPAGLKRNTFSYRPKMPKRGGDTHVPDLPLRVTEHLKGFH
jgi:hypothetical protein